MHIEIWNVTNAALSHYWLELTDSDQTRLVLVIINYEFDVCEVAMTSSIASIRTTSQLSRIAARLMINKFHIWINNMVFDSSAHTDSTSHNTVMYTQHITEI